MMKGRRGRSLLAFTSPEKKSLCRIQATMNRPPQPKNKSYWKRNVNATSNPVTFEISSKFTEIPRWRPTKISRHKKPSSHAFSDRPKNDGSSKRKTLSVCPFQKSSESRKNAH